LANNKTASSIVVNNNIHQFDVILSGADYHHSETLLDQAYRQYSESYWSKKTFAPSSLLFYVGFSKKLKNIEHHNLFFDTSFETHAEEIYFLRPKLKSKKVKNLYFTGQLTVPGPGVPPALISGKLVADLIIKHHSI